MGFRGDISTISDAVIVAGSKVIRFLCTPYPCLCWMFRSAESLVGRVGYGSALAWSVTNRAGIWPSYGAKCYLSFFYLHNRLAT